MPGPAYVAPRSVSTAATVPGRCSAASVVIRVLEFVRERLEPLGTGTGLDGGEEDHVRDVQPRSGLRVTIGEPLDPSRRACVPVRYSGPAVRAQRCRRGGRRWLVHRW